MASENSTGGSFRPDAAAEEAALRWAALQRLPTYQRARKALLHGVAGLIIISVLVILKI